MITVTLDNYSLEIVTTYRSGYGMAELRAIAAILDATPNYAAGSTSYKRIEGGRGTFTLAFESTAEPEAVAIRIHAVIGFVMPHIKVTDIKLAGPGK